MNNTFKKNLIAASIGAVLAAGSLSASANSLLFPYFTTASGAQSVLTLTNTDGATWNSSALPNFTTAAETLHYVYNYGAACTHFDTSGTMSINDVMSHSIADPAIAGGFGKVVGTDQSTPGYFSLANQYGFLTVTNKTSVSTTALQGSMAIVDPATGMVVSYAGISNGLNTGAGANEGNYSGITDLTFAMMAQPDAMVTTSWYASVVGDMSTAIAANRNWTGAVNIGNGGLVWNNDESPKSGVMSKQVICGGNLATSDLMNAAQVAAVGTNGSLIKATGAVVTSGFSATDSIIDDATGVVLMKMQTVKAAVGAPFAGKQFLHREAAGY